MLRFLRLNGARPLAFYNQSLSKRFSSQDGSVKPFNAIPGPKPFPFLGNISVLKDLSQGKAKDDYPLSRMAREYGNIYKIYFGSDAVVVINDADSVQTVFRNEGKIPVRNTTMELNNKWIHEKNSMPVGMAMAHKNDWKRLRSAMTKQVTPRRVTHFTEPLSLVSDSLCEHIRITRDANGWMTDIAHPMQNWATRGIIKVVYDEDIDTFSDKNGPQTEEFLKVVTAFISSLSEISRALPIYKIYPTKPYKNYVNILNRLRELGRQFLTNRFDKLQQDIEMGIVDEDVAVGLLHQWLIEGNLTEDEAFIQACDMLGVGVDTTSNTATFLLHELAKNDEIQDAVYKEIIEVVGPDKPPTAEQLQKLSLVRKCVKETLRLHPLLPATSREIVNDIVILGYHVPAGTICLLFLSLGMDPRYFEEPTKFNPERWSHDSNETHPFASLPFGFGPRMCYGRRIAELELYILITRILQKFKLSTDQTTLKQSLFTVLQPDEPVRMKFIDA